MNVSSAHSLSAIDHAHRPVRGPHGRPADRPATTTDQASATALTTGEPSVQEPVADTTDRVPGVIRLLEAGHFRGVADVRLRIVHADRLAARARQAGSDELETQGDDLVGAVRDGAGELLDLEAVDEEGRQAIEGQIGSFEDAVAATIEAHQSGDGALDVGVLQADLQAAFDELVAGLRGQLAPAPEPVDDEAAVADGRFDLAAEAPAKVAPKVATDGVDLTKARESQPASAVSLTETEVIAPQPDARDQGDPLAALIATFDSALQSLVSAVEEAMSLPPLSPPHGNGVAYERFLAMYTGNQAPSTPTVDTAA